ncbi:thioredoxin [Rothia sp. (in: high G+C Gram-positive bacteria)]|uniref:thioredoxin n=1 Tax=unclassified Rothia (in: high G+C Gram-positive bacteria) TaxID=2689056 RepID=UPI000EBF48C1|nr:thioredoxin [Rothia sp. (in: high G+C Gram-positive bacteria)]
MAQQVTDATFSDEVLRSDKPVIVDFWAEWCGPCRMVGPIVDQIGEEYGDKVKVLKLDVENNPATAMKYGITSIPAIYVFKDGEVAKQTVGAKPKAALEQEFAEFLK